MEMAGEILGQLLAACVGTAAFSALFGVPHHCTGKHGTR